MPYLLLLETSGKNCSVALVDQHTVLRSKSASAEHFVHAEQLHVLMQELFTELQIGPGELAAVAVSKGPGSYTGLRIGVSAAKGLCFTLNLPLIAIDTTEILAHFASIHVPNITRIITMIDARRMEVYAAHFDSKANRLSPDEAMIIDENSFQALRNESVVLIGDGAEKCSPFAHEKLRIVTLLPNAEMMHQLAIAAFERNQFEDVAYFEPFYLKEYIPGTSRKSVL